MQWDHDHLYSWRAQQTRARRERRLNAILYVGMLGVVATCTTMIVFYLSA